MSILVVVESPSKAKKIGQMLGAGYVVQASGGHIRDLPVGNGETGYNADTLEPVYEITERGKSSVQYLKAKMAGCDSVLLATDPDREGESIGWAVAEVLKIKNRQRVKFREITDSAIRAAINNPAPLDMNLVRAQEARRVIDRMVGWLVSGPLSRTINEKASAGRVQSPSLGLVVEREREIARFVREQIYSVQATFAGAPNWTADWKPAGQGDDAKCKVRAEAERAAAVRQLVVREFVDCEEAETPPAPFDTAVMQQAASVALGFDPEKTMQIAQKLFEGHGDGGFITYHRTDETNLSEDGFLMIAEYARAHGLPVVANRRKFKANIGAQEGHEAIRPTHFDGDTSTMSPDELALYQLIHRRAVACQLADVVYAVRRARLEGEGQTFAAVGRVVKNKGWRSFGVAAEVEDAEEAAPTNAVPVLTVGQTLTPTACKVTESWTRAPGRYTKAALVKTLKALGIGRPSTYAPAVDGLEKRGYVALEKRYLVPTAIAGKIYDALTGKFAFIRVDFTRSLEADLDSITEGKKTYSQVVRGMFNVLHGELAALGGGAAAPVTREPKAVAVDNAGHAVKCPKCNGAMVVRTSAKGEFFGCKSFPKCKGTKEKEKPLAFLVPN